MSVSLWMYDMSRKGSLTGLTKILMDAHETCL